MSLLFKMILNSEQLNFNGIGFQTIVFNYFVVHIHEQQDFCSGKSHSH